MCGISGVVYEKQPSRAKFISDAVVLGYETLTRGGDAWGIIVKTTKSLFYHKEEGEFSEKQFKRAIKNLDEPVKFFAIHCRAATSGSPSNNENNHPVISPNFWVMHNGVVRRVGSTQQNDWSSWHWSNWDEWYYQRRFNDFIAERHDKVDTILINESLEEFLALNPNISVSSTEFWSKALEKVKRELVGSMALCIVTVKPVVLVLWGSPMTIAVDAENERVIFGSTEYIVNSLAKSVLGLYVKFPSFSLDHQTGLLFRKQFTKFRVNTVTYAIKKGGDVKGA